MVSVGGSLSAVLRSSPVLAAGRSYATGTGTQLSFHRPVYAASLPAQLPLTRLWQDKTEELFADHSQIQLAVQSRYKQLLDQLFLEPEVDLFIINRANQRVANLFHLESHHSGANSLLEYFSYQVLETIVFLKPEAFAQLMNLFAGIYHLSDLFGFAADCGLVPCFEIASSQPYDCSAELLAAIERVSCWQVAPKVKIPLIQFLASIEQERSRPGYAAGMNSDAYALPFEDLVDIFEDAIEDPMIGEDVQKIILQAVSGSLPFLKLDRLLHLLIEKDYTFKIRELLDWPWSGKGIDQSPSRKKLITAHVDDVHLAEALKTVPAIQRGEGINTDLKQRRAYWTRQAMQRLKDNEPDQEVIADLLEARQFPPLLERFTRELAARLRHGHIELRFVTQSEMDANRPKREVKREAIHLLPEENGGRAAILLLNMNPTLKGEEYARQLLQRIGLALHEFVHIKQTERNGPDWPDLNILTAEMEAHTIHILLNLEFGDDRLYRHMLSLSPFGFAMGLRNHVEQLYIRERDFRKLQVTI